MRQVGADFDKIKYLISGKYIKDGFVLVDDLSILGLNGCKQSDIQYVVVCEELIESDEAKAILKYYSMFDTYGVSLKVFNRIASKENCAGIMALTKLKQDRSFLDKDNALVLVCDGLEISGNIGTIFRTSEAVNIDGIVFTNTKAKVIDDKVVRSSRGMIFNVPFFIIDDLNELLNVLNEKKFRKAVCEPEQGKDLKEFDYSKKLALVVGSERYGVNKIWFEGDSEYLKIEMLGEMDSLNVGVATSIILYEAMYSRKK